MKNLRNLKTWAIAFAVCGLAVVASCDKDDDNTLVAPTLEAPTNLTEAPGPISAMLSWTSNAPRFEVQISSNSSYTYNTTEDSFLITELELESTYNWRVRALNDEAVSVWASGSFTTLPEPRAAATVTFTVTNIEGGYGYTGLESRTWSIVSYLANSNSGFSLELYPFDYATLSAPLEDYTNCGWGSVCYNNTQASLRPYVYIAIGNTAVGTYTPSDYTNSVSGLNYNYAYDSGSTNRGTLNYDYEDSGLQVVITANDGTWISGTATGRVKEIVYDASWNQVVAATGTLTVTFENVLINTNYQPVLVGGE
jgi:hypothetical protein